MRWFVSVLCSTFLICALGGCGEEEGAKAGKIPAPAPPEDLKKLFEKPVNKKSPSRKGAQLIGPPPGYHTVAPLDHRIA